MVWLPARPFRHKPNTSNSTDAARAARKRSEVKTMATKLYKQTFKGRPTLAEVHEEIGRRGGMMVRVDQSDAGTTAYFEASEAQDKAGLAGAKEDGAAIEEVSVKEVTKI